MKLGNLGEISEGVLCNDADAANCPAAGVFWNHSPFIQLQIYLPCFQVVFLLSLNIKLYSLVISWSAANANPF